MPQRSTVEVNGAEIRRLRKHSGLDMDVLAARLGISANYLSRIETGTRRRVRPSIYGALRVELDATETQLLADSEKPKTRED